MRETQWIVCIQCIQFLTAACIILTPLLGLPQRSKHKYLIALDGTSLFVFFDYTKGKKTVL